MANKVFEYDGKVFINKSKLISYIMDTTGQKRNIAALTASNTILVQTKYVDGVDAIAIRTRMKTDGTDYVLPNNLESLNTDKQAAKDTRSFTDVMTSGLEIADEKYLGGAISDFTEDLTEDIKDFLAIETTAQKDQDQIDAEAAWVELQNAKAQQAIALSNALLAEENSKAALKSGLETANDILMKGQAERGIQSVAAASSGLTSGNIRTNLERNKQVTATNSLMAKTKAKNDMAGFLLQRDTFNASATNFGNQQTMFQDLITSLHRDYNNDGISGISAEGQSHYSTMAGWEAYNSGMDLAHTLLSW